MKSPHWIFLIDVLSPSARSYIVASCLSAGFAEGSKKLLISSNKIKRTYGIILRFFY